MFTGPDFKPVDYLDMIARGEDPAPESPFLTVNGHHFRRDDQRKWIPDEEANRQDIERAEKQNRLIEALTSRRITDKELEQIAGQGYHVLVFDRCLYDTKETQNTFNSLLLLQILRELRHGK
jgi:hypothetical protein